jgi:succinate dehydrogenase / fumarate reductase, flavoprotein subunit
MTSPSPRRHITSVLVVGAGGAGLRAAIAARDAGVDCLVVSKRSVRDAHTVLAAGGVNAALGTMDPEDSWQQHAADTAREGYFLADLRVVEGLCREAPRAIEELVEWGARLAREPDGRLSQRYFGAHRYRRTCFAGDYTGREIQRVLVEQAIARGVAYHEAIRITQLLVDEGRCFGAYGFDIESGERHTFLADAVIIATGGHTRLWRRSSSRRDENIGDGMALALRAGCRLADMELVQFHPTGITWPEDVAGTLVTEAVRGEGGVLTNSQGERFMSRYDADRLELSTRDRVALANYTEISEGRGTANGGVLLDVSQLGLDRIRERLPRTLRQMLDLQMVDISRGPVDVAPTAHYSMGGIVVNADTHQTDIDALYAAGEVTTGLHGANRLGGNSLSEVLVYGRIAGTAAAAYSASLTAALRAPRAVEAAAQQLDSIAARRGDVFARPLQREIRDTLWEHCGVVRDGDGLNEALRRIGEVEARLPRLDVRADLAGYKDLALACDLHDMTLCASATILGALERRETRGCHNRADFPEADEPANIECLLEAGELRLSRRRPFQDASFGSLAAETGDYDTADRLLE